MANDILITNIKGLVQVRGKHSSFLAGIEMAQLPVLLNAFLYLKDGLIGDYGAMDKLRPFRHLRPSMLPAVLFSQALSTPILIWFLLPRAKMNL